jgi:hypothetical protein
MDKITWLNVRDDPVCYIAGLPFASRPAHALGTPLQLGLGTVQLHELEARLMETKRFTVRQRGLLHEYKEDQVDAETGVLTVLDKAVAPLEHHWDTTVTPLEHHWNTTVTPLLYHCNSIVTSL